jgi:DNA processing protein
MRLTAERLAQMALLWSEAVGPAGLARLLAHFGGADRALRATRDELASPDLDLRPTQVASILSLRARLPYVEADYDECTSRYIRGLFPDDPGFPPLLRDIANAPALLTIYGNWLPTDDPAVAIVGTRTPTPDGARLAAELARACAATHATVVSGMAAGVDRAAHEAALAAGGRTVAVVGSGLLALHRRETGGLEARIATAGAVISEVAPHAQVSVAHLMARNRLTSGLARAVVVVQARARGGSLVTAEYARKQGREVAAAPWPEALPEGVGCAQLLRAGARSLAGADGMAALVEDLRAGRAAPAESQPQLHLPEDE